MSNDTFFSRRNWLAATGLLSAAQLLSLKPSQAATFIAKTLALTPEEIEAIEAAMDKKGTYDEAQPVHTTPLPRNDLKLNVKGEPVPIPFGFGGWASIKRTLDGKSAVLMSDNIGGDIIFTQIGFNDNNQFYLVSEVLFEFDDKKTVVEKMMEDLDGAPN